jgi:hypothetical protein
MRKFYKPISRLMLFMVLLGSLNLVFSISSFSSSFQSVFDSEKDLSKRKTDWIEGRRSKSFDSYFLRSSLNFSRMVVQTSVVTNKNGQFEKGKYANPIFLGSYPGSFYGIPEDGISSFSNAGQIRNLNDINRSAFDIGQTFANHVYSFPDAQTHGGEIREEIKLNYTDFERAEYVGRMLSNSLNQSVDYMNPSRLRLSKEELFEIHYNLMSAFQRVNYLSSTSTSFSPLNSGRLGTYELRIVKNDISHLSTLGNVTEEGWIINAVRDQYTDSTLNSLGRNDSYSFTLKQASSNRAGGIFLFGMKKYIEEPRHGILSPMMSVQMLQLQALRDYYVWGRTSEVPLVQPSKIERDLIDVFENVLNGTRNALGLLSINELVFSEGTRSGYYYGIFPREWVDNMSIYYIILNILAIASLSGVIVKMLLQQTFSIMNPSIKTSFMVSLQKLLGVILLLLAFFPMFNILAGMNYRISQIFLPVTPNLSAISSSGAYNGLLSGLLISTGFFVIMLIFNVIYILRAISIAILIAASPICISMLAFGDSTKNIFSTWMKELIANIFIQTLHVIMFGLAFRFLANASIIETLVMLYAVIPITEMFRGMILGTGAGTLSKLGLGAIGVAGGALGAASSGFSKAGYSSPSKSYGSDAANSKGESGSSSDITKRRSDTNYAMNTQTKPTNGGPTIDGMPQHGNTELSNDSFSDKVMSASGKVARVGSKFGQGALNVAGGTARTVAGAATMAVTGGSVGKGMVEGGAGQIGRGMKQVGSTMSPLTNNMGLDIESGRFNDPSFLGAKRLDNGDLQVTKNQKALRKKGIEKMHMAGQNNQFLATTYNPSAMGEDDKSNLMGIVNEFGDGKLKDRREKLRELGIENVQELNGGRYRIDYNAEGMNRLGGIQNVHNTPDGRTVETRNSGSEVANHNYTYRIPQQLSGGSGGNQPS